MTEDWIKRYFSEEQIPEVLAILSEYGTEKWHREEERVKRDLIILSKGSIDKLKAAIKLATCDYRDVLIGEEIDPWVIGEIKKYGGRTTRIRYKATPLAGLTTNKKH